MPRKARARADSQMYHVMLRGINRQQIILAPDDYGLFLEILRECKPLSGFKLFAYCLMGNHIHLLIKVETDDISVSMKRIDLRFVQRMNRRYGRSGHLFQYRYKSEIVTDDGYFLNLIRYIHQNPVKTGLAAGAAEYRCSSCHDYVASVTDLLTDTDKLYSIIDRVRFDELMREPVTSAFLDNPEKNASLSDRKALSPIIKIAHIQEASKMRQPAPEHTDKAIIQLCCKGVSARRLSRLTGIPRGHTESVRGRKERLA